MKYEEIVEKVRVATSKTNVSRAVGHIAFQFNVEGEGEGAFYLEIADGKVYVEPYEYYDRDVIVVTTADVIMQMIEGGLQPMVAYTNGQLKAYGNINHLKVLPLGYDCKQTPKANSDTNAESDKNTGSDKKLVSDKESDLDPKSDTEKNSDTENKIILEKKSNIDKKVGSDKKLRKKHLRK